MVTNGRWTVMKSDQIPSNSGSNVENSTSSSLLEGLRNQEGNAWCQLVEMWTPMIYGHCRRRGFSAEDADDITQCVFARVYSGLPGFERDGVGRRFRYWIAAITRNEIADFCRRNKAAPRAAGGSDCRAILESLPALTDESSADWCQPALILSRALDVIQADFKPENWQAFELVQFKKFSNQEAGEQLGIAPGTVRQATFRIRQRLKETLQGLAGMNGIEPEIDPGKAEG